MLKTFPEMLSEGQEALWVEEARSSFRNVKILPSPAAQRFASHCENLSDSEQYRFGEALWIMHQDNELPNHLADLDVQCRLYLSNYASEMQQITYLPARIKQMVARRTLSPAFQERLNAGMRPDVLETLQREGLTLEKLRVFASRVPMKASTFKKTLRNVFTNIDGVCSRVDGDSYYLEYKSHLVIAVLECHYDKSLSGMRVNSFATCGAHKADLYLCHENVLGSIIAVWDNVYEDAPDFLAASVRWIIHNMKVLTDRSSPGDC